MLPQISRRLEAHYGIEPNGVPSCCVTEHSAIWYGLHDLYHQPEFGRFIPLSSDLATELDTVEKTGGVKPLLEPPRLIERARAHFLRWAPAKACACARLAARVAHLRPFASFTNEHISYACESLYYARHCFEPELIEHIVQYDICDSFPAEVNLEKRFRLLIEIAALIKENGDDDHAGRWIKSAERLQPVTAVLRGDLNMDAVPKFLRWKAEVSLKSLDDRQFNRLIGQSLNAKPPDANHKITLANLRAIRLLRRDEESASFEAYRMLLPSIEEIYDSDQGIHFPKSMVNLSAANAAELLTLFGLATGGTHNKLPQIAVTAVQSAQTLLSQSGHKFPKAHLAELITSALRKDSMTKVINNLQIYYTRKGHLTQKTIDNFRWLHGQLDGKGKAMTVNNFYGPVEEVYNDCVFNNAPEVLEKVEALVNRISVERESLPDVANAIDLRKALSDIQLELRSKKPNGDRVAAQLALMQRFFEGVVSSTAASVLWVTIQSDWLPAIHELLKNIIH